MKHIGITVILTAACAGLLFAEDVEELLRALGNLQPAPALTAEEIPPLQAVGAEEEVTAEKQTVTEVMAALMQADAPAEEPAAEAETKPAVAPETAPSVEEAPVPAADEPAAEAVQTDEISMAGETVPGSSMQDGRISLSLKSVTLQDIVRLFSQLSNANIIVPSLAAAEGEVEQRIDVNLSNVEWKPALQAILETQNMELYEKIPGTEVYGIRTKIPDAPEPMEVRVFRLDYATVSSVTNMIGGLVGEGGEVSAFPARNVIVVKSIAQTLSDIEDIIERIDLPREQVFIEAKFMELTDSTSDRLGIDWQVLSGYGASAGPFGANYSRTKTDAATTGDGTDDNDSSPPEIYTTPAGSGLFKPFDQADFSQTLESQTLTAVLNADKFNLVLAALKQINGANIVSNPKLIVANEETARIYIGTREPNIKQETTQVENTDPITTYNLDPSTPYFEYGIKLDVTPTVNTSSNISVSIMPSLTRFLRDKTVGSGGTFNSFPVTTEKTIKTVFGLQSGQTAAIGGLTEVNDLEEERKVPVLGSIPLLGRLFSYSNKNKTQTETIIFVTVGLANPDTINVNTGLPEDTSLARRYQLTAGTDRAVEREKIKVLETTEQERLEEIVNAVQAAEEKRLSKK